MSEDDSSLSETRERALVKTTELSQDWQQLAVDVYAVARQSYEDNEDIAAFIKKEFDLRYTGVWNCVVGKDFGW